MNVNEEMKKFVEPNSVAILGASRSTGEDPFNIMQHLLSYGYEGRIYPVNPNATEILGMKAYPNVADVNEPIDLAIITLPRSIVPRTVKECAEQGIRSIIIVAQGFADAADEEGKRLQKEIEEIVKKSGVRILGPNTMGTANAFTKFSSSFARLSMAEIPVGLICQTGFFLTSPQLKLIGKGIDLGNACDVGFTDGLEYFEQDNETRVIALHIEGIRDGKRFLKVAGRLTWRKPVLAFKTGRSEYAAQAAQSHTGSLVGKDEVWEAALRQCGVIRIDDIDELNDSVKAFSILPLMKGRKVGIISFSGGLGIISIDACHQFNLEVANFSPVTTRRISALSPSWQSVGNPADIWPAISIAKQPEIHVLTESIDAILSDYEVDAVFIMWAVQTRQACTTLCETMTKLAETYQDKPLVCYLHGPYAEEAKNKLNNSRIMVAHTPQRAIKALARVAQYSAFREGF